MKQLAIKLQRTESDKSHRTRWCRIRAQFYLISVSGSWYWFISNISMTADTDSFMSEFWIFNAISSSSDQRHGQPKFFWIDQFGHFTVACLNNARHVLCVAPIKSLLEFVRSSWSYSDWRKENYLFLFTTEVEYMMLTEAFEEIILVLELLDDLCVF